MMFRVICAFLFLACSHLHASANEYCKGAYAYLDAHKQLEHLSDELLLQVRVLLDIQSPSQDDLEELLKTARRYNREVTLVVYARIRAEYPEAQAAIDVYERTEAEIFDEFRQSFASTGTLYKALLSAHNDLLVVDREFAEHLEDDVAYCSRD